jgi:alkylation response protein AidB-like acyl-CoA dehydrogenase
MAAITAYEHAKSGKPIPQARGAGRKAATTGRRGSKRDGILAALADVPHGLTRGELLDKMGLKGNKSGEMSVSNALTALTKGNQVVRRDGKYIASMG